MVARYIGRSRTTIPIADIEELLSQHEIGEQGGELYEDKLRKHQMEVYREESARVIAGKGAFSILQNTNFKINSEWRPQWGLGMFAATIQMALGALKSSLLINAGAAAALLAFVANIAGKEGFEARIEEIARLSLPCFAFGVLASAVGAGLAYLAQYHYGEADQDDDRIRGTGIANFLHVLTAVIIISAYVLFGCFIWTARSAMLLGSTKVISATSEKSKIKEALMPEKEVFPKPKEEQVTPK